MNITVIGAGNVGGALAKRFSEAGHKVFLGVRNVDDPKVKELISENISAHSITDTIELADIIVVAIKPSGVKELAKTFGDVSEKIIIDAMNSFNADLGDFKTTAEALSSWTNCKNIVKCFNTTGANNMENPDFNGEKIDMFVAGDSSKGKEVASNLAKEIGFGEVYDLGGNEKFFLIEQLALVWISMAMNQGRNIGIKIIRK